MKPFTMVRSVDEDGGVWFVFTPRDRTETLTLSPDNYQSGTAMRADVMAWIGTLDPPA